MKFTILLSLLPLLVTAAPTEPQAAQIGPALSYPFQPDSVPIALDSYAQPAAAEGYHAYAKRLYKETYYVDLFNKNYMWVMIEDDKNGTAPKSTRWEHRAMLTTGGPSAVASGASASASASRSASKSASLSASVSGSSSKPSSSSPSKVASSASANKSASSSAPSSVATPRPSSASVKPSTPSASSNKPISPSSSAPKSSAPVSASGSGSKAAAPASSSAPKASSASSSASKPAGAASSSAPKSSSASPSASKAAAAASSSAPKSNSSAPPTSKPPVAASSSAPKSSSASSSASKPAAAATSSTPKPSSSSSSKSSAAGATASGSVGVSAADKTKFLTLHNDFRAKYSAGAVVWDDSLANFALKTAQTCKYGHTGGPYGENIAAGVGGGYNIDKAFSSWANEDALYDFSKPGYSSATGHFTQIVWKGTGKIGCAAASCADGTIFTGYRANSTYVVCEYQAPGNVVSSNAARTAEIFTANVGPKV